MNVFPAMLNRQMGTVNVSSAGVEFIPHQDSTLIGFQIPSHNLQYAIEGKNSDQVVIYSRTNPDVKIRVQDLKVIKLLENTQFYYGGSFKHHSPTKRRVIFATAFVSFLFVLLVSLPFIMPKLTAHFLVKYISNEQELKIGKSLFVGQAFTVTPPRLNKTLEMMQSLVLSLKEKSKELSDIDVQVVVSDSMEVNAYATLGAVLIINTGFLQQAQSTEEILGVMAHELGHIHQRHALKGSLSGLGTLSVAVMMNIIFGTDASNLLVQGSNLINLKHTREDEREADEYALLFLKQAQISAQGLLSFFSRINEEEQGKLGELLQVLSTHPMSTERMQYINEFIKNNPYSYVKPAVDIQEIKKSFAGL